jgi:hypothetical protein
MVGLSIDAARGELPRARTEKVLRNGGRRTFWEALLWGAATETCAECGSEVEARSAHRKSSTVAYCSLEHAQLDEGG